MTTPGSGLGVLQRIQEVLREHRLTGCSRSTVAYAAPHEECMCREWVDDHEAHVAALVLALLEPEWAMRYDGESIPEEPFYGTIEDAQADADERCKSCDSCRGADPKHVVGRFVSSWQRES